MVLFLPLISLEKSGKILWNIFWQISAGISRGPKKIEAKKKTDEFSTKFYQRLFEFILDSHQVPADWFDEIKARLWESRNNFVIFAQGQERKSLIDWTKL